MTAAAAATVEPYQDTFDEETVRWFLGCQVWRRAGATQTGGAYCLIEQIAPPGLGSPYHVHRNEDESVYILEGETRFFSEGHTWVLGRGDFAFLPRGIPHGFRTEGDTPSRALVFTTTSGFEDLVAELSAPLPPAGPPDLSAVTAVAGRYGLEILGPLPE